MTEAEKIEEQNASLNWHHIYSTKNSAFSFKSFTWMSESCTALLICKVLISFITVFLSTWEKWKLDQCLVAHIMVLILGWFLCFRIAFKVGWLEILWWSAFIWCSGILRLFTMFEKKLFRVLAISFSLKVVLPFSINKILSLDLFFSEKNGLTVCKNFLLLVISFSLRFVK